MKKLSPKTTELSENSEKVICKVFDKGMVTEEFKKAVKKAEPNQKTRLRIKHQRYNCSNKSL
jgi:hypothetical protein